MLVKQVYFVKAASYYLVVPEHGMGWVRLTQRFTDHCLFFHLLPAPYGLWILKEQPKYIVAELERPPELPMVDIVVLKI